MPERDEALRAAYFGTTWSVRASGGTHRLAPGRPAPPLLRPSAIVTAYNPWSAPTAPAENRGAARRLLHQVRGLGLDFLPARSHDSGPGQLLWSEPGLALLGPAALGAAIALGAEFRQNAILTVDAHGRVEIIVTRPGFCGLAVGERL